MGDATAQTVLAVDGPSPALRACAEAVAALPGIRASIETGEDAASAARRVADTIAAAIGAKGACLYGSAPRSVTLVRRAASAALAREESWEAAMSRDGGPVRLALRVGRALTSPDVSHDPRFSTDPDLVAALEPCQVRSVLVVPLCHDGPIGAIAVADTTGRQFSDEDVSVVEIVGHHAALALDRARSRGEAGAELPMVEVMSGLARTLNGSLDLDTTLVRVADGALMLCRCRLAGIALRDGESDQFVVRYSAGEPALDHSQTVIAAGQGAGGQVLVTGLPFRTDDYARDPRIATEYAETRERLDAPAAAGGRMALLVVPIRIDDRIEGLIYASDPADRRFSAADEAALQRVAEHAGVAIRNARVHTEAQQRLREAEILLAVSQAVDPTLDATESMRRVARATARALGADMVGVYQVSADQTGLVPIAGYHVPRAMRETFRRVPIPLKGHPFLERAWVKQEPAWSKSARSNPDIHPDVHQHFPHQSAVFLPMVAKGQTIGGIFVIWFEAEHEPTDGELRIVEGIARQAALTLENVRLYEDAANEQHQAEVIAEMARTLNESLDVGVVLQRVAEAARELCSADTSRIALREEDREDAITFRYWAGTRTSGWKGVRIRTGQGLGGLVLATGKPHRSNRYADDARLHDNESFLPIVQAEGLVAVMAVPIRSGHRVEGVLFVDNRSPRPFTDRDESILGQLADHAAISLRNARLFQETERRRREAEELSRLAGVLTETLDVSAVGKRIVDSVTPLFGVPSAGLRLLQDDGSLLAVAWSGPAREHYPPGHVLPAGRGLASIALATGQPVCTRDALAEPDLALGEDNQRRMVAAGLRSALSVPLRAKGRVIGVLQIADQKPRDFSAAEVALAQALADQAALALQNARLLEITDERARRLATLSALTREISSAADSREVFDQVSEAAVTLLGAATAHVWVDDPGAGVLRLLGRFGLAGRGGPVTVDTLPHGDGVAGAVFLTRQAEYVVDLEQDPRWVDRHLATEAGLRAAAAIPLVTEERVVGVLSMLFQTRPEFTPDQKELMGLLADQAAIAIRNKRAEEELRAANSETETLLTSISWILVAVDGRHRITRWNAAAESTFGIPAERVVGRPLQEAGVGWDWATIGERIDECRARQHPSRAGDVRYQRPDGREGILSITASLIGDQGDGESGLLLLGSDITELRVLEVQLSHAQKLESIGQLAAGVAHEINTPIQFVGDNVHFLEDSFRGLSGLLAKYRKITAVPPGSPLDPILEEVRQAEEAADVEYLIEEVPRAIGQTVDGINRVATIVRAMKEFAHPDQGTDRVLTDINQALTSTLTVARNEIKYVADVDTDFGELPLVVCLPGDLNQVFLNLIINAAHAIGAVVRDTRGKGRIGVRTRVDGDSVLIAISDTGTGVPEHIRGRIFDPFFTTKEVGKGTGQGLAIARNVVVDKHGGTLTFETEMGRGTTFLIRLPVAGRNG